MMFQDDDSTTDFTAGAGPSHGAGTDSAANEPRIHARLHEPMRWKQLFRDAVTLTLDTLDDAGERMRRELGLQNQPTRTDDAA